MRFHKVCNLQTTSENYVLAKTCSIFRTVAEFNDEQNCLNCTLVYVAKRRGKLTIELENVKITVALLSMQNVTYMLQ